MSAADDLGQLAVIIESEGVADVLTPFHPTAEQIIVVGVGQRIAHPLLDALGVGKLGTGGDLQSGQRDEGGRLVNVSGQLIHLAFPQVAQRGEIAGGVAVHSGIADGQLALVAVAGGGSTKGGGSGGQQYRTALSGLHILRHSVGKRQTCGGKLFGGVIDGLLDGQLDIADAEIFRQLGRDLSCGVTIITGGHIDTQHVFLAECGGKEAGIQAGINAAGKADGHFLNAENGGVVTDGGDDASVEHLGGVVLRDLDGGGIVGIDDQQFLGELLCYADHRAVGSKDRAAAVIDINGLAGILYADVVGVDQCFAGVFGEVGEVLPEKRRLVVDEAGGGQPQQYRGGADGLSVGQQTEVQRIAVCRQLEVGCRGGNLSAVLGDIDGTGRGVAAVRGFDQTDAAENDGHITEVCGACDQFFVGFLTFLQQALGGPVLSQEAAGDRQLGEYQQVGALCRGAAAEVLHCAEVDIRAGGADVHLCDSDFGHWECILSFGL